eukprot:3515260-Pleurochrysis_carterae.AAC.2
MAAMAGVSGGPPPAAPLGWSARVGCARLGSLPCPRPLLRLCPRNLPLGHLRPARAHCHRQRLPAMPRHAGSPRLPPRRLRVCRDPS